MERSPSILALAHPKLFMWARPHWIPSYLVRHRYLVSPDGYTAAMANPGHAIPPTILGHSSDDVMHDAPKAYRGRSLWTPGPRSIRDLWSLACRPRFAASYLTRPRARTPKATALIGGLGPKSLPTCSILKDPSSSTPIHSSAQPPGESWAHPRFGDYHPKSLCTHSIVPAKNEFLERGRERKQQTGSNPEYTTTRFAIEPAVDNVPGPTGSDRTSGLEHAERVAPRPR
ncbi:hypothetical protein NL676_021789 [Syzygium grande]|nr:hypothetical protein NL676_021789 [Syzygium grande]